RGARAGAALDRPGPSARKGEPPMKSPKFPTGVAAALAALAFAPPAPAADAAQVERGRYLVSTAGCHDCHTPFKMGANGPEPDLEAIYAYLRTVPAVKNRVPEPLPPASARP